ncbi:MAG: alanine racemase [Pseudomonadota bacterium]|nr:alanine racemase [Pseudomonadota bacterium]
MKSVLSINTNAIAHNLQQIKSRYPDVKILAYLKQNAYSLSDELISSVVTSADGFGVTDFKAAQKLRSIYADKVIVDASLPPLKSALVAASKQNITVVVYSLEMIELIVNHKIKGNYWLKISTGFNRLGISVKDADDSIKKLEKYTTNTLVLMTHFMDSEVSSPILKEQMDTWLKLTSQYRLPISHARSCTLLQGLDPVGDWVRPGLMLYGLMTNPSWDLKLAVTLKAPIYQIRNVKAGDFIGYDHSYQFENDTRVAIVAIGYGDGFPLELSAESRLAVKGKQVSIVGKVSMDFIAINIGSLDVAVGDYVEIIGPNADVFKNYPHAPHAIITNFKHRRINLEVTHHA